MAPSASMLFLSYHQLHHCPAAAPAHEDGGAGGGVRLGFSNVFLSSLAALAPLPRREAAVAKEAVGGERGQRARVADDSEEAAALERKFDEALRLSCWSS
ncbi:uncharacterized protein LOC104582523 [Brachypodium distachyon]|uniref:Uncharacterized protein n=1 Tax=Brachypodium distachyon TaxID=15368 RepID=I1GNU1_BRADI|nr:uncharacterized protein LOC104582523 [Brachypodium distachyon]KQK13452.1 hypothetical protein BRADI_1g10200v3 [Brachypodium distachyon]|eukprot:XP_010230651.1 uncharacterized protein LOC104582523 [Brachypodium distachyon]